MKTRLVEHPKSAEKWFICPKELKFAHENADQYFVYCLSIAVSDLSSKKVVEVRGTRVGLREGLVNAVRTSAASIFLQVSNDRLMERQENQTHCSTSTGSS